MLTTAIGRPIFIDFSKMLASLPDPSIAIRQLSWPIHGQLQSIGRHHVTFDPDARFQGSDQFSFCCVDQDGHEYDGIVRISVQNMAPFAAEDHVDMPANDTIRIAVLGNGDDPEQEALSLALTHPAGNGLAVVESDRKIRYSPNYGFVGTDTFGYRITDVLGVFSEADVKVTVNPLVMATSSTMEPAGAKPHSDALRCSSTQHSFTRNC